MLPRSSIGVPRLGEDLFYSDALGQVQAKHHVKHIAFLLVFVCLRQPFSDA